MKPKPKPAEPGPACVECGETRIASLTFERFDRRGLVRLCSECARPLLADYVEPLTPRAAE